MFLFMSMDWHTKTYCLVYALKCFCLYIFFSKKALIFLYIWICLHGRHWLFNLLINYDIMQDKMWSFILQRTDIHHLKLSHPLLLLWAYLSIRSDVSIQFLQARLKAKLAFIAYQTNLSLISLMSSKYHSKKTSLQNSCLVVYINRNHIAEVYDRFNAVALH